MLRGANATHSATENAEATEELAAGASTRHRRCRSSCQHRHPRDLAHPTMGNYPRSALGLGILRLNARDTNFLTYSSALMSAPVVLSASTISARSSFVTALSGIERK